MAYEHYRQRSLVPDRKLVRLRNLRFRPNTANQPSDYVNLTAFGGLTSNPPDDAETP